MSEAKAILEDIIQDFTQEKFKRFFREKSRYFAPKEQDYSRYNDDDFVKGIKIGEINFPDSNNLLICAFRVTKDLTERSGKKAQYDKARIILKANENQRFIAGIFIFFDDGGNFRFSLIYAESTGTKKIWSFFRRYTYYSNKDLPNKTFLKQIGEKEFTDFNFVKEAFSITAVTELFYEEFFKIYKKIVSAVMHINKVKDKNDAKDFVLLFVIRTIFVGFIQKKKWIGSDEKFIQNFFEEYRIKFMGKNTFYQDWLSSLFFDALNSRPGHKIFNSKNIFSKKTELSLQMAPYLNGGLFRRKQGYDTHGWIIPDAEIHEFLSFLFMHSFTIEENSLEDEELQLNPEFLGIIFERLVNKEDGAVYTPRTEVDLMCRLSLLKWLQKNLTCSIKVDNLYELFFKESENDDEQKYGSFSKKETQEILRKLENISICDPAVGSGAFLVGMMQVLDEVEQNLRKVFGDEGQNLFERKKQIISNSLYGVEVKEWAVWICQLRLWLSLFVDAPDDLKNSFKPILPSLDFKVRQGDSLVQRIGSKTFPVLGHANLTSNIKKKVTELKNLKSDYFNNKIESSDFEIKERELTIFADILRDEIEEKRKQLRNLKSKKPATTALLFNVEKHKPEQQEINFNAEEISKLELEIEELEDEKKSLRKDKPLIWNIEFAEIFVEKEGFDLIVGNPPYVKQSEISDPTGKVSNKKEYISFLEEMVKIDFPNDFSPKFKLNAQSDLYTYFYIRGLRLLNSTGIQTYICSNSWLDVGYGTWLQEFLLKRCSIDCIIDNHNKRSFKADVNTIISVINAPRKRVIEDNIVKFVAFKLPFEECIFTENLLKIENAAKQERNNVLKIYPITIKELLKIGTESKDEDERNLGVGKYIGDKWGAKFLRAPDIYNVLVLRNGKNLTKLEDIADVITGCYSGINDFFYLDNNRANTLKIEKKYLVPIIRNSENVETLEIVESNSYYVLAIPPVDKKSLSENVKDYIKWGEKQTTRERQKTKAGILWPLTETVKTRKYWYSIPENNLQKANLFMQYVANDRFYCPFSLKEMVSDRCFHRILLKNQNSFNKIALILNSSFQMLIVMLMGRSGLGQGALKFETTDAKKMMTLKPDIITSKNEKIDKIIKKLGSRKPLSIFIECGINPKDEVPIELQDPKPLPDRKELDDLVFDALSLTIEERKDVYRAVCRLTWNRISKANSV